MKHLTKWSACILSILFTFTGYGQSFAFASNHLRLKGDDLPVSHPHLQSNTEKKLRRSAAWANFNVPILEIHDTIAIPNNPYTISPEQLDEELSWLKSHGFHSVTLSQIYHAIYEHAPLPQRPISLTFDDGYESNFTTATPLLQKYGFVATEFMVTDFIGKQGFLTADELKQMQTSRIWDIESHTVNHANLTKLDLPNIILQVTQSRQTLESLLGTKVNYFSYPYGFYNESVLRVLMNGRYRLAVCTRHGYANPSKDGPLLLNRIAIHQGLPLQKYIQLLAPSLMDSVST